ncbi:hypothetical protein [Saccharopolyspora pogona]|uniref:hypothetical protein n=1 Tax=Saccharopolyspora pogona TaxID=333966 RepID=UPI0016869A40|nr:hypothetical protein [Saccharopolyspora pogona]
MRDLSPASRADQVFFGRWKGGAVNVRLTTGGRFDWAHGAVSGERGDHFRRAVVAHQARASTEVVLRQRSAAAGPATSKVIVSKEVMAGTVGAAR